MRTHVPSYGPQEAEYAAVGQSPGRQEGLRGRPFVGPTGSLARDWIRVSGIDPEAVYYCNVYEYVLLGSEKPTASEVQKGVTRVLTELSTLPMLRGVALFGSFAARCAFSLKGGITRVHGRTGHLELPDGRSVPCIACLHPSFVARQTNLRRRQQLDHDCRTVVARLRHLDETFRLPAVTLVHKPIHITGLTGVDTETASQVGARPDPRRDPLLITGLSNGKVVPLISPAFDNDAEPVAHNIPFDPVVLRSWEPKWHDSKMLAHLVGEEDTSMKGLATRLLGRPMMDYDPVLREKAAERIRQGEYDHEDVQTFSAYCVQDAIAHRDLYQFLWQRADAGTRFLYETVERPMLRLYSRWTMRGVFSLDRKGAMRKHDAIQRQIDQMRRKLKAATGVDSPHQHKRLKEELGLSSTDARFVEQNWPRLSAFQRKVLTLVGELRSIERQRSTYLEAWLEWPDELLSTVWRPTAAWTGRPGSANLNLQNIPGPCGRCDACQRHLVEQCPFNLKPLLMAPPGTVLYELDNSQAELRVAAHLSQDKAMLQAFREGIEIDGEVQYDLHAWAQHRLGIASRKDAKIRVLATFYGQTEQGARADTRIQEAIRRTFSGYVRWSRKVGRLSIVPGLFGRRLYVPPHPDPGHREREAINAPSQGGAVDILKLQAVEIDKYAETRHAIHDSVLIAVPESDATPELEHHLVQTAESAVELDVPLKVEISRWPHY